MMDRKLLELENAELKRQRRIDLIQAEQNETLLNQFFEVELELLACNRLCALVDILLNKFRDTFRLSSVTLFLFDPEHIAADLLSELGHQERKRVYFQPDLRLLRQLHPHEQLAFGEVDNDIRKIVFPDHPYILSAARMPLVRQNCLIGCLNLGSQDIARYTADIRYTYLSHLMSVIAVCIENCMTREHLHRISIIDMLTSVHNRRAFDKEILREVARANRVGEPLSCLFIDIDHFKKINDVYGHQTGDRVLRTLGKLLKGTLRKTDFVARYGGEEFSILLPSCAEEQAMMVAENLRTQLAKEILRSVEGAPFRITASIGCASYQPLMTLSPKDHQQHAHVLLRTADEALYQAKHAGRNRTQSKPLPAAN